MRKAMMEMMGCQERRACMCCCGMSCSMRKNEIEKENRSLKDVMLSLKQ